MDEHRIILVTEHWNFLKWKLKSEDFSPRKKFSKQAINLLFLQFKFWIAQDPE